MRVGAVAGGVGAGQVTVPGMGGAVGFDGCGATDGCPGCGDCWAVTATVSVTTAIATEQIRLGSFKSHAPLSQRPPLGGPKNEKATSG